MLEELPGSLRRVLALRQFATLSSVDLTDLANVAENVDETTLLAGNRIAAAGRRLPAVYLIADGRIECGGDHWGPREMFGLLEVLAGQPTDEPATATTDTRVFRIAAADLHEILEDNFGLLRALLGELAGRLLGQRFGFGAPATPAGERLTLVERVIALRQHSPLAGGRLQALTAVAQLLEQRRWERGERVIAAGAPADTVVIVLDGELRAAETTLGPGDALGVLEAFATVPHTTAVEVVTPTTTLSCSVSALIDVLEDHADLGLSLLSTFAGRLLANARARN